VVAPHRIGPCGQCRRTVALPPGGDLCDVCRRATTEDPEQQPGGAFVVGCLLVALAVVLLFAAAWFIVPEQWS
jgi:hypothetical protein